MKFRPEDRYRLLEAKLDAYRSLEGVTITRRTALRWATFASLIATVGCAEESESESDDPGLDAESEAGASTGASEESEASGETSDGTSNETTGTDESSETGSEPLTLEELMAIVHPWAVELVAAANPDDLSYNADVEELLLNLVVDLPDLVSSGYDLEALLVNAPVEIFEIHMAPGATIPLHDHRDYIGSILGVEGSVDATYYTKMTDPDPQGWFEVQEISNGSISPGSVGSLGLVEGNFHVLTAGPQGAKLVDVFTFFDPQGYSNWAELDPTPINAAEKIYRCRFT
jgi:predicted metal-dependent enzyme (double-stranded beta helix superfamily)